MKVLLLLLFFCVTLTLANDIIVCQSDKKYRYRIELANLILSKTSSNYGSSKIIEFSTKDPTQARCVKLLKQNQVDLLYLPITQKRLDEINSIKIDMHNGMLGYRVLIINKEDQNKFKKIRTLQDLQKFKGGFGFHWGDYKIFSLNKLPVVGVANTNLLLKMLSKKRFDYFHRGLNEAWEEVDSIKKQLPNLIVEESIVLVYNFPVYFMFNKNNKYLKQRFEEGFKIILKDGSFKKLYKKYFSNFAKKLDLKNRTQIHIKYPIPKNIPKADTSIWKTPNK